MRSRICTRKGSMVVEASIVVPIIIICIFIVIYITVLLYQKTYIQSIADKTAERGALLWSNAAKNMDIGMITKANLNKAGLYRSLGVFDYYKERKINLIKSYAEKRIGNFNVLQRIEPKDASRITIKLKDYIIYKKLEVTIKETYKIPIGKLLGLFGSSGNYIIEAKSETIINEPSELIRNSDFLIDIERELENENPGLKDLGEKSRGIVDNIKNKINSFTSQGEGK